MRICIYGADAIGGYIGMLLSQAEAEVLVAPGPQIRAGYPR
jgi:ketopantoate reductase